MSNPNETLVPLGDWRHSIHSSIPFISGSIIPDTFHIFDYSVLPFIEDPQVVTYERLFNLCLLSQCRRVVVYPVNGQGIAPAVRLERINFMVPKGKGL